MSDRRVVDKREKRTLHHRQRQGSTSCNNQHIREMENRFFFGERKTLINLQLAIRRVVSRQLAQTRALAERNSLIYLVG